jgi:hypothetical protein
MKIPWEQRLRIQRDFENCFSGSHTGVDGIYLWARNTREFIMPVYEVLDKTLDFMALDENKRGDKTMLHPEYPWGINFNPLEVRTADVTDYLRSCIPSRYFEARPRTGPRRIVCSTVHNERVKQEHVREVAEAIVAERVVEWKVQHQYKE